MLDYPVLLAFPMIMAYAAVMDFFTMTIPNRVSLALVAGFLATAVLGGMAWREILMHAGVGCGVLVLAIAMFSQGWVGGGDAKLLAAASLWFGLSQVLDYFLMVAIFGGILSVTMLAFRHAIPPMVIAGRDWAERLHNKKTGIPYGVALAAAALWLYPSSDVFKAFAA